MLISYYIWVLTLQELQNPPHSCMYLVVNECKTVIILYLHRLYFSNYSASNRGISGYVYGI
jgi:hypothetical protein